MMLLATICLLAGEVRAAQMDSVRIERDDSTSGYVDIETSDLVDLDGGDTLIGLSLMAKKSLDRTLLLRIRLFGLYENGVSPVYDKLSKWKAEHTTKGYERKDISLWLVFSDGTSVQPEKATMTEMAAAESIATEIFCQLDGPQYVSYFEDRLRHKKVTHIVVEDVWFPVKGDFSSLLKRMFDDMRSALGLGEGYYRSGGVTLRGVYLPQVSHLEYVRKELETCGRCKAGCISEAGYGIVFIDEERAAWSRGLPIALAEAVKKSAANGDKLTDVCFLDGKEAWVVISGTNGYAYSGIPVHMANVLKTINQNGETIRSVSFNRKGQYAILTDKRIYHTKTSLIETAIKEAGELFGEMYSISLSERGIVICCARGVYYNHVPPRVSDTLQKLTFRAVQVRFTDAGCYLIVGEDGRFTSHM